MKRYRVALFTGISYSNELSLISDATGVDCR